MVTPYLFAFELCINEMITQMEGIPEGEKLAIIFDRLPEFAGRAHKVVAILMATDDYKNKARLGSLRYMSKTDTRGIPLQAADVLAYETMRSLRDPDNPRWQMHELRSGYGRIAGPLYYTPEHVDAFVRRLHATAQQRP